MQFTASTKLVMASLVIIIIICTFLWYVHNDLDTSRHSYLYLLCLCQHDHPIHAFIDAWKWQLPPSIQRPGPLIDIRFKSPDNCTSPWNRLLTGFQYSPPNYHYNCPCLVHYLAYRPIPHWQKNSPSPCRFQAFSMLSQELRLLI